MVELQICNSPTSQPILGCREYQPVTDNALGALSSWWRGWTLIFAYHFCALFQGRISIPTILGAVAGAE